MSDIYCRDCRACKYIGGKAWCACRARDISDVDPKCDCFRRKRPTLFDRITESPEILAADVVYPDWAEYMGGDCWTSPFVGHYHTKEEAYNATVAKLKEVYDETTSH